MTNHSIFWTQNSILYLISEMWIDDAASSKPKQNPMSTNTAAIIKNDWLNPKVIQQIVNGTLTIRMVRRRPILSQIGPLNKLPIGWAMKAKLVNHDDWAAVSTTVSPGFRSGLKPVNDGITIDGNAANSAVFSVIKFLAVTAKIYNQID